MVRKVVGTVSSFSFSEMSSNVVNRVGSGRVGNNRVRKVRFQVGPRRIISNTLVQ